jgi:hypothetical protein
MTSQRAEVLYRAVLSIRMLCDQYGLNWEWDDANGGLVIWSDDVFPLSEI